MTNMGLTSQEVADLTAKGLYNRPVENQSKSVKQIIAGNVFTYFNLIFFVFTVLIILVRSYRDLTFLGVIISNTLIGIIQEIRSKRVLDRLSVLHAPKAVVIRDGTRSTVDAVSLVLGDLVVFGAGNQICADGSVLEGEIQVNESLITGESEEITKRKGDSLLSGSFVVSGSCKAVLEKVGHDSYVSQLTIEAKKSRHGKQSEMIRSLDKLVKVIGIIIIPVGIGLYAVERWKLDLTVKESVMASIAALIGMIPEGLYLLASVALVVSVIRLATKKVLVQEMSCIEMLARVNVLCLDKTGTITENIMEVNEIVPLEHIDDSILPNLHKLLGEFVHSMEGDNITMETLQRYFDETPEIKADKITSFSSVAKYSSATFGECSYVIGAPESVLRKDYEEFRDLIESYSLKGQRVLVYGTYYGEPDGKPLTGHVTPHALIIISNPVRKEAKTTFKYFESQGVKIKVISGDNPITVSNVAKKAGITGYDRYVDAATLLNDEDISDAAEKYTVFGRVNPRQKRMLVQALKAKGNTVAMTGDGVNDVLALKDADCSIAMASGSDAASNASQLVLLDSNFECLPSVVFEGRRVVNNLQRSASLFLIKNIFSMLMALFSLLMTLKYPLVPSQISLLGMFTIGTPALLLAMQPNKNIIKGHFLTNVLLNALPAGLTDFIAVAVLAFFGEQIGIPFAQLSTIAISIMLVVGIVTLIKVCMPFDIFRFAICIAMCAGIAFCVIFLNWLFAISMLTGKQFIFLAFYGAAMIPLLFIISKAVDKSTDYIAKRSRRFRKRLGR